ncbi:lamin tail domain-containing protein [Telluribacter sp. SYSU D00476]|uniref:lamin tail domain-containing protein n=1 Tax=Telluribacter sp. SYSU D00476 TaxID=2811430 RepID=UPI001FF2532B|nr:lamin tail domain-containing protein [Telluribacter sp. SYSU D00476]
MIRRIAPLLLLLVGLQYTYGQSYNSVVITEIMADPTPVVGLPDAEYIELYNRSQQPVSLRGWRLVMGNRSAVFPDSLLAPGQYAIVCGRPSLPLLSTFGKVIVLSSVTLPNEGATLALRDARGQLVFAVTYSLNWWPQDRRQGGYAIEMVDTDNPCGELDNWRVSTSPRGGTPATANSVRAANPDLRAPAIERVDVATANQMTVQFSERLDSLSTTNAAAFALSGRQIIGRTLETPSFRRVTLTLDAPLQERQSYELKVRNIADCAGNLLREEKWTLGLPTRADSGDVVLSEILFNPRTGGVDFVEVYNRTSSYFNLKDWALGNVRAGGPANLRILATDDLLLGPNEYLAFTTDPAVVQDQYPSDKPRRILRVPSLPSFPNVEGGVVLLDQGGRLFDRFDYHENYHSPLLLSREGVSLERMYFDQPANTPSNWHSAASTVGYATPGYANSQGIPEVADGFVVEPEAFTPDDDGMDDYASIRYTLSAAGQVATIRIFDTSGRLIKNLVQNQLIGTTGDVRWDGTDERGEAVRMGYYLLLIDTFDTRGNTQQYKKRVVVVRR